MALLYSFLLFQNKYKITLYCRKPLPKCEHMFYNEFEVVNMIPNLMRQMSINMKQIIVKYQDNI